MQEQVTHRWTLFYLLPWAGIRYTNFLPPALPGPPRPSREQLFPRVFALGVCCGPGVFVQHSPVLVHAVPLYGGKGARDAGAMVGLRHGSAPPLGRVVPPVRVLEVHTRCAGCKGDGSKHFRRPPL